MARQIVGHVTDEGMLLQSCDTPAIFALARSKSRGAVELRRMTNQNY